MKNSANDPVIAIIPARGGSKGIPGKNIKMLAGKPLIAWTIEHAYHAKCIDHIYVSTDSIEIARVAQQYGAEVVERPADLSGDQSSSEEAIKHVLAYCSRVHKGIAAVVFLQATSPIRGVCDIDRAYGHFLETGADSLLSVNRTHAFVWENKGAWAEPVNYCKGKRPMRQEMAPQFKENGSIYIFRPEVIEKYNSRLGVHTALYEMREECSIDIDTPFDFLIADQYLSHLEQKNDNS